MSAVKIGALERYSQRLGRLVERHLADAALTAAKQEAQREAANANQAKREIEATALTLRDEVAARKKAQSHLAYLAAHDPLTTLPNRSWFNEKLKIALTDAKAASTTLAVLYIDLDNFKDVNDTLGHDVGDALLRQVAGRLSAARPHSAAVARIGGDEFAVILPDIAGPATAVSLGSSLIAGICHPFEIDARPIFIGASVGISLSVGGAGTVDQLRRHADLALYRAKADGRNRLQLFDQTLNDEVHRRSMLEQALREPGLFDQLRIVYQPQFDLRSNQISGVEALVRWQHPEHGWIWPSEFIPVAERSGMIIPIGNWVLQESCRQAALWRAAALPPLTMSVNVSALQFRAGNVAALTGDILRETGLPGDCLELEITETAIMNAANDPVEGLIAIHDLGVRLAIDDFGTGYSSLSYLRQIPVDRLKIDQSFIRDIPASEDAAVVAATIVQLAHSLRLQVVAEGVESQAQLDFIRQTGCGFAQGFYYSKPVGAVAVARLAALPALRGIPS